MGKGAFSMPPADEQDTIFEFLVNEQGDWEHWSERVSSRHYFLISWRTEDASVK